MGTITNEIIDGYSVKTCTGVNSTTGIIDFRYNGSSISSSTQQVTISPSNIINFSINVGLLKKYQYKMPRK